jgi:hypothetical protein
VALHANAGMSKVEKQSPVFVEVAFGYFAFGLRHSDVLLHVNVIKWGFGENIITKLTNCELFVNLST